MPARNRNLNEAAGVKYDEFYTQLHDVAAELIHYQKHFKNKTIYCNCDDPRVSAFFKYFTQSFEDLKLKKLVASCYKNQDVDLFSRRKSEKAVFIEYTGRKGTDYTHDDIEIKHLNGDGDFRSDESIALLKQADIIVTNPPFSLFREYVAQLVKYKKKFIILGNMNAVTYADIFPLLKNNKMWIGTKSMGTDMLFGVTDDYKKELVKNKKEGSAYKIIDGAIKGRVSAVWYTNLDIKKRHEELFLYQKYKGNESDYPKYDNYNAIEVSRIKDIPKDYKGAMGVPITFLDKYNPEQFDIVGLTSGRDEFEVTPTKRYENPKQINKNGTKTHGGKANTRATLLHSQMPNDIYYTADNAKGYLSILYARILIKNKNPRKG